MKKVLLVVLLGLSVLGCRANAAPGENVDTGGALGNTSAVKYVHDTKHGVGCWFFIDESGSSISCLSDKEYNH